MSSVKGPIVGYFGAIAEWFDLELMKKLARELPEVTFILLGGVFSLDGANRGVYPTFNFWDRNRTS